MMAPDPTKNDVYSEPTACAWGSDATLTGKLEAQVREEAYVREEARRAREASEVAKLRAEVDRMQEIAARDTVKETRPAFAELQIIEKKRRALLRRVELPYWRILFFWTNTCVKDVSTDVLVWFTLLIYAGIRITAHLLEVPPEHVAYLETGNIAILGGFLSFFLVMFVDTANSRFLEMYSFSKECSQRLQDVAGLARVQLPREIGLDLVRHFHAAHIAGYVGLNSVGSKTPYSRANFFDVYNQKYRLLTTEETKLLSTKDMDHSPFAFKELIQWCVMDAANARALGHLDGGKENNFVDYVLKFRASMDNLYNYCDQPPHFFYVHFLILLSALYLPLFAIDVGYNTGWGEELYIGLDVLNGLIVFLQCIFVVGLRALGNKMIDPFGEDIEDLSVISYIETTAKICDSIMNSTQLERTWTPKTKDPNEVYYSDDDCDDDDGGD